MNEVKNRIAGLVAGNLQAALLAMIAGDNAKAQSELAIAKFHNEILASLHGIEDASEASA